MPPHKLKLEAVLKAARTALANSAVSVKNHAAPEDFHRALVKDLAIHPGFAAAARALHAHEHADSRLSGRGQTPRQVVPAGRVQAPRQDSPRGR